MNLLRTVLANTSAQFVSRLISSSTGFLITILIARHFGLGGYADLAKITALVSIFYLGIDLGANAIFLQFEESDQRFQDLLVFRILLAAVFFVFVVLLVFVLPYNTTTTSGYPLFVKVGILFFSLSFFTRAIVYSTSAIFQKNLIYKNATKAGVVGSAVTLGIVLLTIFLQRNLLWVIIGYVLGGLCEASVSLYLAREKFSFIFPSPLFVKKLFAATLPLTLLLFLNLLYFRIDAIILTFFQKAAAVGLYDYAYKFFDFLIALPLFLSNSLYPHLLSLAKNSRIQRKNISLYAIIFFFLGLALIPLVWFVSPLIALIKQDFSPSVLALRLLSLSLPVFFATNILQWVFIAKKKQKLLVWIYGCSLILNVVLNLLFIPAYSYIASAVITGFSETVILLIMIVLLIFIDL